MFTNIPLSQEDGGQREDSRVDVVESTKILQHAIAKAHIVPRFSPKQAALFGF